MHKKLEAELVSIAHQILQMKDKDDVLKLKEKAKDLYEKLSVLVFVDNYFLTTPNATENKKELTSIVENVSEETVKTTSKNSITPTKNTKKDVVKKIEEDLKKVEELQKQTSKTIKAEAEEIINKIIEQEAVPLKNDVKDVAPTTTKSLANNDEFKDSIPADVAADLFEKAENLEPKFKKQESKNIEKTVVKNTPKRIEKQEKTSLNDKLFGQKIQVGLNDRIAFVKHLFNFSQEDFNRVLSQLNTFETENTAKDFLNIQVKPEYDWSNKEEYEARLITLIERKFL